MEMTISEWLQNSTDRNITWLIKRLSGNDTLANGAHQAGPYLPKEFLFRLLPQIHRPQDVNPDARVPLSIDSDADFRNVRVVWYNNKVRGAGTRNEARITQLGGTASTLLDPESTGALTVFAFHLDGNGEAEHISVWVCRNSMEEDVVEEVVGPVSPGTWKVWTIDQVEHAEDFGPRNCWLPPEAIPGEWLDSFPSGAEIISKTVSMLRGNQLEIDERLMQRRECEYEIFRSVEEAVELAAIRKGYDSVESFVKHAQSILQRRRSRAGRSLELHLKAIFEEENLEEGVDFSYQPKTEQGHSPDFLFPSEFAYKDLAFKADRLRMLAVKTTCKDRWRQVLTEAERIPHKHLLTLQEGVSLAQFSQMQEAGLTLVVPRGIFKKFHRDIRHKLVSLESFLGDVRLLRL